VKYRMKKRFRYLNYEKGFLHEISERALFIKRFDRNSNDERIHFEELNSLMNKLSDDKYEASYEDIGCFIRRCGKCQDVRRECFLVYKRILANILIGNTDAHLKNFAMFHTSDGYLCSTPMYDIVCSSFYSKFNQLALKVNNQAFDIACLKPKHLVNLGRDGFDLSNEEITTAVKSLEGNLQKTIDVLKKFENEHIDEDAKTRRTLVEIMKKRWNGSLKQIPQYLRKQASSK
jgi:serine/threonine-protein kinase HipA